MANESADEKLSRTDKKIIDYKLDSAVLFVKGKYKESLDLQKKLKRMLHRVGRWEEADIYHEKIEQMKEIIGERDGYLKQLKSALENNDHYITLRLYKNIIVISMALNDKEFADKYDSEMEKYMLDNKLNLTNLDLRRDLLEEQARTAEERYNFQEAFDLYGECEKISLLLNDVIDPSREAEELKKAKLYEDKKATLFHQIAKK